MKIHVAHPGTQHGFRVARIFAQKGKLGVFCTTLTFSPNFILAKRFPARSLVDIPEGQVRRFCQWREWVNVFGARLPYYDLWKHHWWLARNRAFGTKVGRFIGNSSDILYGFDTSSAEMFREGKKRKLLCILDQSSIHSVRAESIVDSAIKNRPQYAGSFNHIRHSPEEIKRRCQEVRLADLILCPSKSVQESVILAGATLDKTKVVPYGIDLNIFKLASASKPDVFRVLFVGDVTQLKGVGYLFEAWRKADLQNAELLVVGNLPTGFTWQPYLSNGIKLLGRISRNALINLYQTSHCVAIPTLLEGQSNSVLEAMACGCCVITTAACGIGEMFVNGKNGILLEPDDIDGWIGVLTLLAKDPMQVLSIGRQAGEAAKAFSLDYYSERLMGCLDVFLK